MGERIVVIYIMADDCLSAPAFPWQSCAKSSKEEILRWTGYFKREEAVKFLRHKEEFYSFFARSVVRVTKVNWDGIGDILKVDTAELVHFQNTSSESLDGAMRPGDDLSEVIPDDCMFLAKIVAGRKLTGLELI